MAKKKTLAPSESYPIQDEPEGDGMLRIDHPRARSRETEPGTDPGFSKRQPRDPLRRRNPTPDLSLDRAGARPAGVPPAEPPGARGVTQLSDEDDGPEPGASDPVDRSLSEKRIAAARALPPSSFSAALHPRRHRTAGHRRCGPRELERSRHAPHSGAGIPPVRQARV